MDIMDFIQNNGPWCAITVWLVLRQDKRYDALQLWVQSEITKALKHNTQVLTKVDNFIERLKEDKDNK